MTAAVARLALAAALAGALIACDSSPTEPTDTSRSGVWTGTVTDPANGSGTLRLVLEERRIDAQQSFWTGTWTTSFAVAANNGSGTIVGGVTGASALLSLAPTQAPSCAQPPPFGSAVGTFTAASLTATGKRITGSYQFATCTTVVTGTLDVSR